MNSFCDATGKITASDMKLRVSRQMSLAGTLTCSSLSLDMADDLLKLQTNAALTDGTIALDKDKILKQERFHGSAIKIE